MTLEQRNNVAIIKGSESEIEALKSRHRLERDKETCVVIEGDIPQGVFADIPRDGFYKEKISALTKKNEMLLKENEELIKIRLSQDTTIEEQRERIEKLEKALVEASIK